MTSFKGSMQDRNVGPLLPDMCVCVRACACLTFNKKLKDTEYENEIVYYLTFILFQITLKYFISSNENVFKVLILVSVLANFNTYYLTVLAVLTNLLYIQPLLFIYCFVIIITKIIFNS